MLAPAAKAARATPSLTVSTEIGTLPRPANCSITGIARRSSSDSATGAAPGRVDSPPTSMISAPCSTSCSAWATAASASRNRPPSKKESGVTLTIPMTSAGRGKVNSNWPARSIMKSKPETRNPKPEGSPKPEARSPKRSNEGAAPSDFALRICFGFRASAFGSLAARAGLGHLYQLDFIALRGVDKGEATTVGIQVRAVGVLQPQPRQVAAELLQA